MKKNETQKFQGIVYSTNPDFKYDTGEEKASGALPKEKQPLRISIDRKGRNGKTVTLVTGFSGSEEELNLLCRLLKTKCGTGGSVKEGEILIQGDFKTKIVQILLSEGYTRAK